MKALSKSYRRHVLFALSIFCASTSFAQRNRLAGPPKSSQRFQLAGHVHPLATSANDVGRLASDTEISGVTVNFISTSDQQASLDDLLLKQRTPGTAEFHQWLSPDEFADRFGLSASDLETVKAWFEAQGLTVTGIARARTWISLSGTAVQMEQAFQTELHRYSVNGQAHIVNSSAPSLPIEFNGIVRAVRGLNDFHARPFKRRPQPASSSPGATPLYTSARGNHHIAPADLARPSMISRRCTTVASTGRANGW